VNPVLLDMARPTKSLKATEKKWIGAKVKCYLRTQDGKRSRGLSYGIVRGITTNQAAAEADGREEYSATGLLVEIPDLVKHPVHGDWPVRFDDAEIYE
jgi:hypothetical protein